jgi:hypothetical protein
MLGSCNNHLQYIDGVIIIRAFLISGSKPNALTYIHYGRELLDEYHAFLASELNIFPHIGVGDIVGAKYHVRIM